MTKRPVYRGYGVGLNKPELYSGAVFNTDKFPPAMREVFDRAYRAAHEPYVGITTDGVVTPGLHPLQETGLSPRALKEAADDFLAHLEPAEHGRAFHPVDAAEKRLWHNAFMPWEPHGLLLDKASPDTRRRAMALVEATFSARGYRDARVVMKLNALLGELIGDNGANLTEWMYWFSIFGEPSLTEPWGWQLMGHHLDLNCFVLGGQLVITPSFMGAEPRISDEQDGPYQGLRVFDEEEGGGLAFLRSLSASQQDKAVLYRSILKKDLPPRYNRPADERHWGGAGQDNLVLAYEGIAGENLTPGQREQLLGLMAVYLDRMPEGHRDLYLEQARRHLDETHFCWIGRTDSDDSPFYYRIHSPVVMIEFDHHSGVFLDNEEAEPFHAHTVVRTPNGNDYGMDLLRQHYARFPHGGGQSHQDHGHAHAHKHGHAHSHGPGQGADHTHD